MFKWLYFEVKQMLFNRKNILILIILTIIHIFAMSLFTNDNTIRSSQLSLDLSYGNPYSYYEDLDEDYQLEINQAIFEGDLDKYYELMLIKDLNKVNKIERYLLNLDVKEGGSLEEKVESYYKNFDLHQKLKKQIFDKYGYKDEGSGVEANVRGYNQAVSRLQYNYQAMDNNFMVYTVPSRDSLTSIVSIYNMYFVFLILIIPIIVGFDVFTKDKKQGSIRTITSIANTRGKYYLIKLIAALIVSIILLIVPLLIVLLLNGVNIVKDLSYPVFINKEGLTSFRGISTIWNMDSKEYFLDTYSIVANTSYNINKYDIMMGLYDGIILSNFGLILLISIILMTFIVLFILSIQLSISININRIVAFLTTISLVSGLFILTQSKNLLPVIQPGTFHLSVSRVLGLHQPRVLELINPLAYKDVYSVVEGSVPFTFLGGIVVLSIYIIIINFTSITVFNKKDITD